MVRVSPKTTVASCIAIVIASAVAAAPQVFRGAVGFGIETRAGRGGKILRVTNLNPEGPGSLRAAFETTGPRIVVFEVGGAVDLDKKNLKLTEPFITVAGQTAPSPGITVIRGGLSISTHDVLIQHVRFRPGDAGMPKKSGWEPEVSTAGPNAYNIVIDHCSFSWAVDENLSASGSRYDGPDGTSRNITFSNNIIAEGLRDSSHTKGPHSMGTLVHDTSTNIAVIGNFYAHNNARNPYFKANTTGVIVNNLIYNPGSRAITVDWPESEWKGRPLPRDPRVAVVGNVLYHGANTPPTLAIVGRKGDVYLEDNLGFDRNDKPVPAQEGKIKILAEKPVWPAGLKPLPASQVAEHVLATAGARPADRDPVDLRIIREFRERKGSLIDSQEQVGGYPRPAPAKHKLNVPAANVDQWLASLAAKLERAR